MATQLYRAKFGTRVVWNFAPLNGDSRLLPAVAHRAASGSNAAKAEALAQFQK